MISRITGVLIFKGFDHIMIDVHGVGYEILLSDSTLAKMPAVGKKISVNTELIVREDLLQLVGFSTLNERDWYRLLTSVQGVGSKAALKILGILPINILSRSILSGDANTIKSTPGIGPKIAQRIVSELKDKVPNLMAVGSEQDFEKSLSNKLDPTNASSRESLNEVYRSEISLAEPSDSNFLELQAVALSALVNLGYSSVDAATAISNVLSDQEKAPGVQELIKLTLKSLSPKV